MMTWLMFDTYLRIGEALGLRGDDVLLPGPSVAGNTSGGIRLRIAKTGRFQSVLFRDGAFTQLMMMFLEELQQPREHPLFGFGYQLYLSQFKAVLTDLGLGDIGFRPHSLRHGDAVHDYLQGHSVTSIVHRGRWASEATASTYLQTGRSQVLGNRGYSPDVAARATLLQQRPSLILHRWASGS